MNNILGQYISHLDHALHDTERGGDIDPLHQSRVVSRRLRLALGIFKKQFDRTTRKEAKQALRALEKALGPARDLDTEIRLLTSLAAANTQGSGAVGAARIIRELEANRRKLQAGVIKAVRNIRQSKTLDKLAAALEQSATAPAKKNNKGDKPLAKLGRKSILKRLKRLRKLGAYAGEPDNVRKLHGLRIAAKYLRYTLEIFRPYYGKKLGPYITAAHAIQNTLGDYHDYDVWDRSLSRRAERMTGDPAMRSGIRQCAALCEGRRPQAYRDFVGIWRNCQEQGMWEKLVKLVSRSI